MFVVTQNPDLDRDSPFSTTFLVKSVLPFLNCVDQESESRSGTEVTPVVFASYLTHTPKQCWSPSSYKQQQSERIVQMNEIQSSINTKIDKQPCEHETGSANPFYKCQLKLHL